MITLPAGELDSDSDSQANIDSSEDYCHDYIPPIPRGDALRIFRHLDDMYGCPIEDHMWFKDRWMVASWCDE
jgi:hypothetical protein